MTDKNLLTVLNIGDESHYLSTDFLQSLPDQTKKVFDSFGFVGDLEGNLSSFRREDMRRFVIFRSPAFEDLVTEYFSSTTDAVLSEIPDKLRVKVDYKEQDTDFSTGARQVTSYDGTIDEMVAVYRELSSTDPKQQFAKELCESEPLRKILVNKGLFGLGKGKVVPTYVSVGLETPEGKYLLATTGAMGPYNGKIIQELPTVAHSNK